MKPLYNVLTWDADIHQFTVQEGMSNPSQRVDIWGVRRALRELREFGYMCTRFDAFVLVERASESKEFQLQLTF